VVPAVPNDPISIACAPYERKKDNVARSSWQKALVAMPNKKSDWAHRTSEIRNGMKEIGEYLFKLFNWQSPLL
jgi:hypothetical protein